MTVFIKARSLYFTSFANKCLNVGLGLIPMLLIEREFSVSTSTWIMGFVKAAAVTGYLLGGWFSDRLGLKKTLVLSFFLSAFGLMVLPLSTSVLLLCAAGMIAQAGQSFFGGTARIFLTQIVLPSERQEAIGWLRMINNGAQIFSYGLSWAFSKLGILVLMFLDAGASLIAAGIGMLMLPDLKKQSPAQDKNSGIKEVKPFTWSDWKLLLLAAGMVASFDFLYELMLVGIAAKYKLVFGSEGLAVFSQAMVINTILCTLFAVGASRWFKRPNRALPIGIVLNTLGTMLCLSGTITKEFIFLGMFILTLGEIAFMAVSSLILIQLTPSTKNQGSIFGFVMSIQMLGRIGGSVAAFPWVVHGNHPALAIGLTGLVAFILWIFARKGIDQLPSE